MMRLHSWGLRGLIIVAVAAGIGYAYHAHQPPPPYGAYAKVVVRDPDAGQPSGALPVSVFVQTQIEIMRARPVLDRVIHDLELGQRWASRAGDLPLEALRDRLSGLLDIRQVRDTPMITIRARGQSPEEAADLANGLVAAYRAFRHGVENRHAEHVRQVMKDAVESRRCEVMEAEQELAAVTAGIGGLAARFMRNYRDQIGRLNADRIAAHVEMLDRKARLEQVEAMDDNQLMEAIGLISDPAIQALRQRWLEASLELAILRRTASDNAPELSQQEMRFEETQRHFRRAIAGARRDLMAQYEIRLSRLNAISEAMDELMLVAPAQAEAERLEQELELRRQRLREVESRLAQEQVARSVRRSLLDVVSLARATTPTPARTPTEEER